MDALAWETKEIDVLIVKIKNNFMNTEESTEQKTKWWENLLGILIVISVFVGLAVILNFIFGDEKEEVWTNYCAVMPNEQFLIFNSNKSRYSLMRYASFFYNYDISKAILIREVDIQEFYRIKKKLSIEEYADWCLGNIAITPDCDNPSCIKQ